jgi:hypothetical protein
MWPIFAPITIKFDRERLKKEILNSKILDKGIIATSHSKDGKNFWNNEINFQGDKFKKLKNVPLWSDESKKELIKKDINTFYQVNLTKLDSDQINDVWEGKHNDKTKTPLWIKYNHAWNFRSDVDLPYTKEIINSLELEYFSMIRIVYQLPPSIGLIHKDSGPVTNFNYYESGGVGITLNVSGGGANLYFLDKNENECCIDEENTNAWHFNDGQLHCTSEVFSERIQIRIYGKHSDYKKIMNLDKAIY